MVLGGVVGGDWGDSWGRVYHRVIIMRDKGEEEIIIRM